MVNYRNGCCFGYNVQIPSSCAYEMVIALPDLGPDLMSLSLPGHLHKDLGEEGKHSALHNRWLT
jgi:hypothetical protein